MGAIRSSEKWRVYSVLRNIAPEMSLGEYRARLEIQRGETEGAGEREKRLVLSLFSFLSLSLSRAPVHTLALGVACKTARLELSIDYRYIALARAFAFYPIQLLGPLTVSSMHSTNHSRACCSGSSSSPGAQNESSRVSRAGFEIESLSLSLSLCTR